MLFLPKLVALGIGQAAATKLLTELPQHAVSAAQAMLQSTRFKNRSAGVTITGMRAGRALAKAIAIA